MGVSAEKFISDEKMLICTGEYGLEEERIRVTPAGTIADTDHPFFGDPHRDRDFSESQLEMITGVYPTIPLAVEGMARIAGETQDILRRQESGAEAAWPFSNPPRVENVSDVRIADFRNEDAWKKEYRSYLADKYGKKKMLYSGIHFNFSFTSELLRTDYKKKRADGMECSFQAYKNALYLDLAGKLVRKCWLIIYLTAASPLFDGSYADPARQGQTLVSKYASPRCGAEGYWNAFVPILDFSSVEGYAASIEKYVTDGSLQRPSELYYPIRLKPRGAFSMDALREGINHIELRMFDLNPFCPAGIEEKDLQFAVYLILYLSFLPEETITEEDQITAVENAKNSALLDDSQVRILSAGEESEDIRSAAYWILEEMEGVLIQFLPETERERIRDVLAFEKNKILYPGCRYAPQIVKRYGDRFVEKTLEELFS